METKCSVCKRVTPDQYLEEHHLRPKCKKGKDTICVCIDCGNQVHKLFTIPELFHIFNTLEALLSNPDIKKWINWVKNKPFGVCMKTKKRR